MSRLSNFYLLTYNSLQAFGWTISLYRLLDSFVATKSTSGAYSSAGELICFLQTAAFLEIIHGAIGNLNELWYHSLVWYLNFDNVVFSPLNFRLGTNWSVASSNAMGRESSFSGCSCSSTSRGFSPHFVQQLPSVFITFLAWSLSEVIRYSHHALNCLGVSLFWLTYLRYTAFIILYPIGVTIGESEYTKHLCSVAHVPSNSFYDKEQPLCRCLRLPSLQLLQCHQGSAFCLPTIFLETVPTFVQAKEIKIGQAAQEEEKLKVSPI
ncbi:Very-long-chain (3R)-3-hydroxyacyl-CoA dehydratase hpo-8 [Cucurbita argyrosperma subsp. argyrosperma]|nr:Very-long-chain (3R)-3-hydroxyacyl-CoA dehydratase hpo-8 [Cucurbita argyrosperma subsp. argyrosperma]